MPESPATDAVQRPDLTELRRGTGLLLASVDGVSDADLDTACRLPGWTRRHLVAHLASNAEALTRLCGWAATGVESRMYASTDQRRAEIETGSTAAPAVLRSRLATTAATLNEAFDALPAQRWGAEVLTAQGRTVPATEIPWMRAREIWLHAIDLDTGLGVADLPDGFCRRLTGEVATWRSARGNGPALTLTTPDARWQVDGSGVPAEVHAPISTLAGWLTGRAEIHGAPELPPWI